MTTTERIGQAGERAGPELDDLVPEARFSEVHRRRVELPIDVVWRATLDLRAGEVRLLGPLMALRDIPARLRRSRPTGVEGGRTMLDELRGQGFLFARCDERPSGGRALALLCGAGRFWSPAQDAAVELSSVDAFLAHDAPASARLAATLEAIDLGGATLLVTETRVVGTDARANRVFGRYWRLIRYPSGMIRRSWLAAIERRARREHAAHVARALRAGRAGGAAAQSDDR